MGEEQCQCGCCHAPDHGACDEYEEGANGRCVYCDHGKDCHPGTGRYFNLPLTVGVRKSMPEEQLSDALRQVGVEIK